jgi:hypothetical protein
MKSLQTILIQIKQLTTNIKTNYPKLTRSLDENPITIPSLNNPHINIKVMKEYLGSLKQLLLHHLETHKLNTLNH